MIKVWTDAADVGLRNGFGARGSTFAYQTKKTIRISKPSAPACWRNGRKDGHLASFLPERSREENRTGTLDLKAESL